MLGAILAFGESPKRIWIASGESDAANYAFAPKGLVTTLGAELTDFVIAGLG
jgi:hypothetical protein